MIVASKHFLWRPIRFLWLVVFQTLILQYFQDVQYLKVSFLHWQISIIFQDFYLNWGQDSLLACLKQLILSFPIILVCFWMCAFDFYLAREAKMFNLNLIFVLWVGRDLTQKSFDNILFSCLLWYDEGFHHQKQQSRTTTLLILPHD